MCGDGGTYSVAYAIAYGYSHARTNTGSNTYAYACAHRWSDFESHCLPDSCAFAITYYCTHASAYTSAQCSSVSNVELLRRVEGRHRDRR